MTNTQADAAIDIEFGEDEDIVAVAFYNSAGEATTIDGPFARVAIETDLL